MKFILAFLLRALLLALLALFLCQIVPAVWHGEGGWLETAELAVNKVIYHVVEQEWHELQLLQGLAWTFQHRIHYLILLLLAAVAYYEYRLRRVVPPLISHHHTTTPAPPTGSNKTQTQIALEKLYADPRYKEYLRKKNAGLLGSGGEPDPVELELAQKETEFFD